MKNSLIKKILNKEPLEETRIKKKKKNPPNRDAAYIKKGKPIQDLDIESF